MSEWHELPGRWLTDNEDMEYKVCFNTEKNGYVTKYRVRETEPKAPTHEEIMTKWWKDPNDPSAGWAKVHRFYCTEYHIWNITATKGFFLNIKSADIPPEDTP